MQYRLRPYLQGDLDALCGPYSIINALRIVLGGNLSKVECLDLLARCINTLNEDERYKKSTSCGVYLWAMCLLLREVVQADYAVNAWRPFARQARASLDTLWDNMTRFLNRKQNHRAIILRVLTPKVDHWSVARRASPATLHLFDSDGLRRLQRKRFGVASGDEKSPYTLFPAQVFFLERRD